MNRRDLQLAAATLGLFLAALAWAVARQPLQFVDFTLRPAGAESVAGLAVLPKGSGPFPVVVYLHGSGDSLDRSSGTLRQFAELGLAAVCMDYTQTNAAAFAPQFDTLLRWVSERTWADTNAVAWVGFSLGAQRMLSHALKAPESAPALLVRMGGGWVPELTNAPVPRLRSVAWLVHGEADETFRTAEVRRVREALSAGGMRVETEILPQQAHAFGANRALVLRHVGEGCASFLDGRELPREQP